MGRQTTAKKPSAAETRRREKQAADAAAAKAGADDEPADDTATGIIEGDDLGTTPNAVVVHRLEDPEGGGFSTRVQLVGDVKVSEVDTILSIARRGFRREMGLDD